MKVLDAPRVADEPTDQNTFLAWAPFVRTMEVDAAVTTVDAV
jgi:hypothetical protein